jgi:hypothetical protein
MGMNSYKHNAISGCVLVAVGTIAALWPFVIGDWAWEWHAGRFLLAVLPGAIAVAGGLVMLGGRRLPVQAGATLALIGGLWFLVAPPVYALFVSPELGTLESGQSVRMLQWAAFFCGAGALISVVSSYVLGFVRPLEFADELWTEPAPATRARMPLPAERPRRQRGVSEGAPQPADHARGKRSARRKS